MFHNACAADMIVIPFKPDPPIAVDGQLDDWQPVPSEVTVALAEQIAWIADGAEWQGMQDLSGTVRLAWRDEGLYLVVEVQDDVFINRGAGDVIFKGDHVELFLDVSPKSQAERDKFGQGQFQLALSPGDLNDTRSGNAFGRITAEVYQYFPESKNLITSAASQKSSDGWIVEALIPWEAIAMHRHRVGSTFKMEVALSDSDFALAGQGKLMTIADEPWKFRRRSRLVDVVLGDANGHVPAGSEDHSPAESITLSDSETIEPQQSCEIVFNIPETVADGCAVLSLQGLLKSTANNGDTCAMTLSLNGNPITGDDLLGKTPEMMTTTGTMVKLYSSQFGFRVPYAATFEQANLSMAQGNRYARFLSDLPRTDFQFNITDLLKEGTNVLKIGNLHPNIARDLIIGNAKIAWKTGSLCQEDSHVIFNDVYYTPEVHAPGEIAYSVASDNSIDITVGGYTHTVDSSFSVPKGQWVSASNDYFTLDRHVELVGNVVLVHDTFTNLTGDVLGIMQRHEIAVSEPASYYLNGISRPVGVQGYFHTKNGTSFVQSDSSSIGMLALNDAFRIHAQNYMLPSGGIGLCDRQLVIPSGERYTAQWVIVPSAGGDYWDFINTLRNYLDVNFLINGSSTTVQTHRSGRLKDWTTEQFREMFQNKSCFYAISAMTWNSEYEGKTYPYIFDQGTAILEKAHNDEHEDDYVKWREADADLKILGYFHCYIDSNDYSRQKYADAAVLDVNGNQVDYGYDYYPIFFPTLDNDFGRAIEPIIDLYFDQLKTDGIFWDEISRCKVDYHYGEPWDGCSGDIDLETHDVVRLKSSFSLITKPWRLKMAKYILQRGYLIGNGVPSCQDMRALKFPCFTETAQSTNAARQQLYSPLVLGDHLSEVTQRDAYRTMLKGLEYGCVYYWYADKVIATHKTLTSKMFPITPICLGPGFIIGKERIITKVGGYFGWGDGSEHDVFVYDGQGMMVPDYQAAMVHKNGQTFSKIVLPQYWSAAIVRKTLHQQ